MNKILKINRCDDCPYFDYSYFDYLEECKKLGVKIKQINGEFPIPECCPLESVNNEND